MNLIVNTRYNERRPTISTSNFDDVPDEAGDPNSFKARVGFRIHSRLHEMCEFLEYDGADYRHLPPNGGAEELAQLWQRHPKRKVGAPAARPRTPVKAALRDRGETGELRWQGGKAGS